MRPERLPAACVATLVLLGALVEAHQGWAEDVARVNREQPRPRVLPWSDPWSEGRPRGFVATQLDPAFISLRATLSAGYGRPHYFWAGLAIGPVVSQQAAAGFVGLRFQHPFLELRSDGLYVLSFEHSFLEPRASYDRRDIDELTQRKASYPLWDTEAKLTIPVGPGALLGETEVVGVPEQDGRFVYLETMSVVAAPPWVFRQRLGYEVPIERVADLRLAGVAEAVSVPERDAVTWRAGALVRWWISHDLELRIDVLPVIRSPDALGIRSGEPLRIVVRWQWASGH